MKLRKDSLVSLKENFDIICARTIDIGTIIPVYFSLFIFLKTGNLYIISAYATRIGTRIPAFLFFEMKSLFYK